MPECLKYKPREYTLLKWETLPIHGQKKFDKRATDVHDEDHTGHGDVQDPVAHEKMMIKGAEAHEGATRPNMEKITGRTLFKMPWRPPSCRCEISSHRAAS